MVIMRIRICEDFRGGDVMDDDQKINVKMDILTKIFFEVYHL